MQGSSKRPDSKIMAKQFMLNDPFLEPVKMFDQIFPIELKLNSTDFLLIF